MALKSFQLAPCETISIFFVPPWPRALGSSPRCLGLGFHGSWCQGCIRLKYFTILQKYFARLEVLLAEVLSKCKSLPNRGLNIRGLWGSQGPPGGTDFFGFSSRLAFRIGKQQIQKPSRSMSAGKAKAKGGEKRGTDPKGPEMHFFEGRQGADPKNLLGRHRLERLRRRR